MNTWKKYLLRYVTVKIWSTILLMFKARKRLSLTNAPQPAFVVWLKLIKKQPNPSQPAYDSLVLRFTYEVNCVITSESAFSIKHRQLCKYFQVKKIRYEYGWTRKLPHKFIEHEMQGMMGYIHHNCAENFPTYKWKENNALTLDMISNRTFCYWWRFFFDLCKIKKWNRMKCNVVDLRFPRKK